MRNQYLYERVLKELETHVLTPSTNLSYNIRIDGSEMILEVSLPGISKSELKVRTEDNQYLILSLDREKDGTSYTHKGIKELNREYKLQWPKKYSLKNLEVTLKRGILQVISKEKELKVNYIDIK